METLGLVPVSGLAYIWPLIVITLWFALRNAAKLRQITIFHNANIQVAFWEEILFRGLVLGILLKVGASPFTSLIFSSLLFGVFHFRNIWWADWRKCAKMAVSATFITGPIFAYLRLLTGDIYLGILIHFLWNASLAFSPDFLKKFIQDIPKDKDVRVRG